MIWRSNKEPYGHTNDYKWYDEYKKDAKPPKWDLLLVCVSQVPPHLVTAGGQALSKGLDGADLVVLYQLCETVISLTVSWYGKLPILILGDDKMAAPVVAPLDKKECDESEKAAKKQFNHRFGLTYL